MKKRQDKWLKIIQPRSEVAERGCMTFQPRSATSERGCMILPMKSKEIHQRFGDHKTLMNDFAFTRGFATPVAKSYHPARKTSRRG